MSEYLIMIELNHDKIIFKKTNNKVLASKFVKKLTNKNKCSSVKWIKIDRNKKEQTFE